MDSLDAKKGHSEHYEREVGNDAASEKIDHHEREPMDHTERAIALAMARAADPGPPMSSPRAWKMTFIALVCCLCSGDSGFDGTVIGAVNSMVQFQRHFGLDKPQTSSSIFIGIYTVGQVLSAFFSIYFIDKIGRRYSMFFGNTVLILGALICGLSQNSGMFLAGRCLVGVGCSFAAAAGKTYLTEVTSPWNRGRWMGLQNSFYYVGQLLASGVSIPLGRLPSAWSWRVPMIMQCALAIPNVMFVLFLPESPRWLYSRGHTEKATRIMANLHTRDDDENSPLVQLEIAEFKESISLNGADKRFWDFRPIFNSAAARYRFSMCLIVACWGQLSGNGLITYFLPVLLKLAGIVSPDRQRILNFVNSITSFVGALAGTAVVDKVGRRTLMLTAAVSCTLGMAIVAGLLSPAGEQSQMRANAGISFIFLFMVFFSFGWTPLQGLYPAECLSFEVRAKGLALTGWFTAVFSLINTFGLPDALKQLGWKTYLIFMAWDIVGVVVIYIWAVETKQLSLEELDEVFSAPNPKKASFALARVARERGKEEKAALAAHGLQGV